MIETMNQEELIVEIKSLICHSDWLWRYYGRRAHKYHWIDAWVKGVLGIVGIVGAGLAGSGKYPVVGSVLAGGSAFILGTILPNFKWNDIVSGLKLEEQEWAAIFTSYERVRDIALLYSKAEILAQEFQKAKALHEASRLNDRHLPEDKKLRDQIEKEVRKFYNLDPEPPPKNN
jgi:hypothetical protein